MGATRAGTARFTLHRKGARWLCVLLGAAIAAVAVTGAQMRDAAIPDSRARAAPASYHGVDGHDRAPAQAPSPETGDEIAYHVEVRTEDPATADFPEVVGDVLADPRGWQRAGVVFIRDREAPYRIVIAEGDEVDRLCEPYETGGRFSCQNGPVVAVNADRWRHATEAWPGSLAAYRVMLVNHEVGHLLHLHHPDPQCPEAGLPSPVMAQQSSGPGRCRAHPWPLQWEIDLVAERREPLAPGADHDPSDHRPQPPAAPR